METTRERRADPCFIVDNLRRPIRIRFCRHVPTWNTTMTTESAIEISPLFSYVDKPGSQVLHNRVSDSGLFNF